MLEGEEVFKLAMLLSEAEFDESPWAGTEFYRKLVRDRDAAWEKLMGRLDKKGAEQLKELLRLQGQMEYELQLYDMYRGLELGVKLAGGEGIPWEKISWEKRNFS